MRAGIEPDVPRLYSLRGSFAASVSVLLRVWCSLRGATESLALAGAGCEGLVCTQRGAEGGGVVNESGLAWEGRVRHYG
jgi:hypothetical protein